MEHKVASKDQPADQTQQLALPTLIFGLPEVRRLKLELQSLEDFMRQAAIRAPGSQPSLPRLSRLCEALATENHLNLLQESDRKKLAAFLADIEKTAPALHISFAADPSAAFTSKIVAWLRNSVHPYALLQVGLQPTIAAGCVLRTLNKEFDFSLRERFLKQEGLLLKAFDEMAASTPITAAETPAPVTVTAQTPVPAAPQIGELTHPATPEQVGQEAIAAALGITPPEGVSQ